ncbi:class I SAM-dependent methyltransferase [Paenibacillus sp. GCM10027627]|uniref:class I SAM-dependent methyltransferase n=1 Tax=unclassified Paenibacillus TaxID=185978 RepID=UPI00362FDB21
MVVYRHRDLEQASREVRQMTDLLALPTGASVLDIGCGMGRHALALAEAGFQVTGVDLSRALLEEARAHDSCGKVEWRQGDMRELPFPDGSFDATVNLFTSFGYFSSEGDNVNVLRHIRRVLRPGGAYLIDFLNPLYVERHLVPKSQRVDEESGLHILEERTILDGWVQKAITVQEEAALPEAALCEADPMLIRKYLERVKLYPLDWFQEQLLNAGLDLNKVYGNYDGSPYDRECSPRMIMAGKAQ